MKVTYDFAGQVALVTGAASGMGLATARAFAHAGAAVTLADINEDALQQAVDEIKSAGGNAIGVRCDVSDESQVAAAAAGSEQRGFRIDCHGLVGVVAGRVARRSACRGARRSLLRHRQLG